MRARIMAPWSCAATGASARSFSVPTCFSFSIAFLHHSAGRVSGQALRPAPLRSLPKSWRAAPPCRAQCRGALHVCSRSCQQAPPAPPRARPATHGHRGAHSLFLLLIPLVGRGVLGLLKARLTHAEILILSAAVAAT